MQADLGGAFYEMAIRDHVRMDVLTRKAAELQRVDAELLAVERVLELRALRRRRACARAAARPTARGALLRPVRPVARAGGGGAVKAALRGQLGRARRRCGDADRQALRPAGRLLGGRHLGDRRQRDDRHRRQRRAGGAGRPQPRRPTTRRSRPRRNRRRPDVRRRLVRSCRRAAQPRSAGAPLASPEPLPTRRERPGEPNRPPKNPPKRPRNPSPKRGRSSTSS